MKMGTKSVLFGVHCFAIHPWFVALAWWRLYGFPTDGRHWTAFFVHDLGYWGKPNMDGPEGETHPELGARIMHVLFDKKPDGTLWRDFSLYHSRFYAKKHGVHFSRLCVADKLATALMPTWLYLLVGNATGEIKEYMSGAPGRTPGAGRSQAAWFREVKEYLRAWCEEHKDGRKDEWTGGDREIYAGRRGK